MSYSPVSLYPIFTIWILAALFCVYPQGFRRVLFGFKRGVCRIYLGVAMLAAFRKGMRARSSLLE